MENFEIHITGNKLILDTAKSLGFKTISINLLKPDKTLHRTEYMTSDVVTYKNFQDCYNAIQDLVNKLKNLNTEIIRVKIESQYYPHYEEISTYIESHFVDKNGQFPLSINQNKSYYLATDREYKKENYKDFIKKYKGEIIELCLYDSYVEEDYDWFNMYARS